MDDDRWEVVYTASGMAQAAIVQGRLEAEGIQAHLQYEAAGQIYAITIDGLGEVRVLVQEHEAGAARQVLEQTYEDGDIDWEQ